jgi:hypothetical protein
MRGDERALLTPQPEMERDLDWLFAEIPPSRADTGSRNG